MKALRGEEEEKEEKEEEGGEGEGRERVCVCFLYFIGNPLTTKEAKMVAEFVLVG